MQTTDIENQMVFFSRKELNQKYGKMDDIEDGIREMNEYEIDLLRRFDENDQEIDEMLEQVINQIDGLKIHAENIGVAITNQKDLIKKLNSKAEQARIKLQKRSSELQVVLNKYKTNSMMCCYFILITVLLVIVGIIISVWRHKDAFM